MSKAKIPIAAGLGVVLWLTSNFGDLWWALLALLAIDAALNWRDEATYWRRVLGILGSLATTAYLQQGIGLPSLHAVVAALVAWEATRVDEQLLGLIQQLRSRGSVSAAEAQGLQKLLSDLEQRIQRMEGRP